MAVNVDALLPTLAVLGGIGATVYQVLRAPGLEAHREQVKSYSEQIRELHDRLHDEQHEHDVTRNQVTDLKALLTRHGIKVPDLLDTLDERSKSR
jgi:hypothetical protein